MEKIGHIGNTPCPKCGAKVSVDARGFMLCYSCGKITGKVTK